MKQKFVTSRELLAASGITKESGTEIPLEHRHLLITSVLEFVPGHKLRKLLADNGIDESVRDIQLWLQATRDWLGLPPAGRGKPSAESRQAVEDWRQANGNPTLEEIDAGWIPAHCRSGNLSPAVKKQIQEFRQMLASLDEAANDDEVKLRLAELLKKLKENSTKRN